MANYIQSALQKVLEGQSDVAEHTCGNYHVWMKYDGYSAMVDINYVKDGIHLYQICHWDSLDKRIHLEDDDALHGKQRQQLKKAIQAIQSLGYEIQQLKVYREPENGKSAYDEDISTQLISLIA
ncbi:hypothetical protein CVD28_01070 [Bacillus sp. M6-12]|uniref:hypothetical protein n=1 Tax=Bacillus sp. M6-12 TaxID=2054166 RepID=UPI000C75F85E|nr:hypothetical protein [Bacillus sp. M6-12]PLS19025.1 hypothetical protein CVD28_01070 [Bacillus sp. M6-12]